ncbi:MAG: SPOR domain-containing protein [Kiloniellaceae bacterium]
MDNSLTISSAEAGKGTFRPWPLRAPAGLAALASLALASLALAGCTIEVGPPPESDPPLVSEAAKAPPPPAQPTEPQAWSRDLDLGAGPAEINREVLQEGLVASSSEAGYSQERLTFESAVVSEKPKTEAELARERARERAAAAGLPAPPVVAAAPVESVNEQRLPSGTVEAAVAASARRGSRLPPPPKFPPLPPKDGEAAQAAGGAAEAVEPAPPAETPPAETPSAETPSAETPPAETPPAETPSAETPSAETPSRETALVAPPAEAVASAPADAATSAFLADAWDAPAGTILVQVSAVQKKINVLNEWARLKGRFPQELQPLRLVIDEAKLGDRGVFYRVQAGAFGSREVAAAACDSLIGQGQACFVVVR